MTSPEDPQFPNEVNIDEEIAPPPHFVQLQSGINYEPTSERSDQPEKKVATPPSKPPDFDYKCHLCSKSYPQKFMLSVHLKNDHREVRFPFACPLCSDKRRSYKTSKRLAIHVRTDHPAQIESKGIKCVYCPRRFRTELSLNKHILIHTRSRNNKQLNNERIKCSYCDVTFKRIREQKAHEAKHGDKFMCQFCPTGFRSSIGLRLHEMKFHPTLLKTHKCPVCKEDIYGRAKFEHHRLKCILQLKIRRSTSNNNESQGQRSNPIEVSQPSSSSSSLINPILCWVKNEPVGTKNRIF